MPSRFLNNININDEYTLPSADGTENQIIVTDGAGNLSFDDLSTVTGKVEGVEADIIYYQVKNSTGATIDAFKGVMAVGTDGNSGHILIDEMVADGSVEARYFLGITRESIPNGGISRVISFGEIDQINTNAFPDGTVLWCDPANPGDFTATEPDGPNLKIPAAFVLNQATNGKIQVRVQGNEGIKDLYDTKITSQVDGDVLVWKDTEGVWQNDSTLNVDYTNSRVGIGTTSPSHNLQVNGTIGIRNSMTSQPSYGYANVGAGDFVVGGNSIYPGVITLYNQDTTISAGQDLGVIQFVGKDDSSAGYTSSMIKGSTQNAAGTGDSGGGILSFLTTSGFGSVSERMRINNAGNVGIGTTSPQAKLHVANGTLRTWSPSSGTSAIFESTANNRSFVTITGASEAELWFGDASVQTKGRVRYEMAGNNMEFWTNATQKMVINGSGNVGIGTTSPNRLLTVQTTGTGSYLALNSSSNNTTIGSDINGAFLVYDDTASTYRMVIKPTTGNVGIGTTSPSYKLDVNGEGRFTGDLRCLSLIQTSQKDQKTEIELVGKEGTTIPIKRYKYKSGDNNKLRYGVVAEDIESVYPELVETDSDGIKGVKYIDLLVRKIAELETEKRTLVNWRHYHSNTSYNTLYDAGMTTAFPYAYGSIPAPYDMYFTSVTLVNNPYSSYNQGPLGDTAIFQAYVNGKFVHEIRDIKYGQNPYESITADFGQNVRLKKGESLQIKFYANGTWRYCNSTIILTEI